MNAALAAFVAEELSVAPGDEIHRVAGILAERLGGVAVLFYGSVLRTSDLNGVLDFYVLTARLGGSPLRRLGTRLLWPDVSYHEVPVAGRTLRAKVATMPIGTFEDAAAGTFIDTTIWSRFVQPAALVWRADTAVAWRVLRAISSAAITAGRFAAALGPVRGTAHDHWAALFRETYEAELRIEKPGRADHILTFDPARYAALLPLAWAAGGVPFDQDGRVMTSRLSVDECRHIMEMWLIRARLGKALNLARLVKAAFTFQGAARYGLWKVERHTGVRVALTPWRERHPILAAPGVFFRLMRTRAS